MKWIGLFLMALVFAPTQELVSQKSQADSAFEAHRIKFDPARNPESDVQSAITTATRKRNALSSMSAVNGAVGAIGSTDSSTTRRTLIHTCWAFCCRQSELQSGQQEREIPRAISRD